MSNLESLILSSLFYNEKYTRKVLPHIKGEYFEDINNKIIYEETSKYFVSYDGCLLYTSPSPRDRQKSRMPSSA